MKKIQIKHTDLKVSAISLGSVEIGSRIQQADAFALMDAYIAAGGNMIDTAEVYGNWLPVEKSISEVTIGKWMRERGNRNQLLVSTKGAHPDLVTMHLPRLSKSQIISDLESSLRRLQVEHVDLYWLHRDDKSKPVSEILEVLEEQVQLGKIRYYGCSNWELPRLMEAIDYAHQHNLRGFIANQLWWSVAAINKEKIEDKTMVLMDEQTYEFHRKTDLALFAHSSQAKGIFAKMLAGEQGKAAALIPPMYQLEENNRKYRVLKEIANQRGITVSQVVIAYLLSQPLTVIPVVSARTVEQLMDIIQALNSELSSHELKDLAGETPFF